MRPPKLRELASQSVHLQATYGISNTFQQRPSAILNFKNFNIWSHDCHCGPNLLLHTNFHQNWFTRSASIRPWLHKVQCAVARQRPSPSQPHHSGHVGHMMGCDQPSCVPVGPLVGELCHLEYFPYGGRPPFWILKILIFNHVTVVLVLTCCCVPNFIKIGSRVRPPGAHNCRMFNAPLLGNGRRHGNQIVGDMSGTWWDVTTQVSSKSVLW